MTPDQQPIDIATACGRTDIRRQLLYAERQRDKLAEALDRIARPVWWMQEDHKRKTGSINGINGAMALSLSEDPYYLKRIATEALQSLKKTAPHEDTNLFPTLSLEPSQR